MNELTVAAAVIMGSILKVAVVLVMGSRMVELLVMKEETVLVRRRGLERVEFLRSFASCDIWRLRHGRILKMKKIG